MSEMDKADHTEGQATGKLDALKGARPVWRGEVRKVPRGNSLASYPVSPAPVGRGAVEAGAVRWGGL